MRAGRLKAVAVDGHEPMKELPSVPLLSRPVPPNSRGRWNGIVMPARTPKDVVNKLNANLIAAVRSSESQERFANLMVGTITTTLSEFNALIRSENSVLG